MGNYLSSHQTCVGDAIGWSGLTNKEKTAVNKTMKKLAENSSANGEQLFLRFFKLYPSYKNIFPAFRDVSGDKLEGTSVLRAHGMMVINTLTRLIDQIDDYHRFRTTLHQTVSSHFKKGVRIHNYQDMFIVFRAFMEEKCGVLDQTTIGAWSKVAAMILEELQEAMDKQTHLARVNERISQASASEMSASEVSASEVVTEDQNHNDRQNKDQNKVDGESEDLESLEQVDGLV